MLCENHFNGSGGVREFVDTVQFLDRADRLLLGRVFKVAAVFQRVHGIFQKLNDPELSVLIKQFDYIFFGSALGYIGNKKFVGVDQINIWKANSADLSICPLKLELRGGLFSLPQAERNSR